MLRDLGSTNGTFVNGVRVVDDPLVQQRPRSVRRSAVPRPSPVVGDGRHDRRDPRLRLRLALVQFDQLMSRRSVIPCSARGRLAKRADGRIRGFGPKLRLRPRDARRHVPGGLTARSANGTEPHVPLGSGPRQLSGLEKPPHLFLNTHPAELADPDSSNRCRACETSARDSRSRSRFTKSRPRRTEPRCGYSRRR